ncbi:MAG: VanZ family protein [Chloroflexota bacterium]
MSVLLDRLRAESGLIALVPIAMLLIAIPLTIWRVRAGDSWSSAVWKTALDVAIIGSLAGMLALTLSSLATGGQGQINLIPFQSLFDSFALGEFWVGIVLVDLAANFLLYVPLGLFVGLRLSGLPTLAWALPVVALSAAIEVVQGSVLNRSADVTDGVMNWLGGVAGFAAARMLQRLIDSRTSESGSGRLSPSEESTPSR